MKKALTLTAFALGTFAAGVQGSLVQENVNCKGATTYLMEQDSVPTLSDCMDLCTNNAECGFYMYRESKKSMPSKCKLLSEQCSNLKGGSFSLYEAEVIEEPQPKCGRHRNKKLCKKKGGAEGCEWNNKSKKCVVKVTKSPTMAPTEKVVTNAPTLQTCSTYNKKKKACQNNGCKFVPKTKKCIEVASNNGNEDDVNEPVTGEIVCSDYNGKEKACNKKNKCKFIPKTKKCNERALR